MFWNISPYFHVSVQDSLDVGAQFQDSRPTLPCGCCTPQGSHRVATTCEERTLQIDRSMTQDLSTKNIKMWAFKIYLEKCWHLPNVDLARHPALCSMWKAAASVIVAANASCCLSQLWRKEAERRQGMKKWRKSTLRKSWRCGDWDLLFWLKFSVAVSIDEYFKHSWLQEEFWPRLTMVMLKERCFVRLNFLNMFKWPDRPYPGLVISSFCRLAAKGSTGVSTLLLLSRRSWDRSWALSTLHSSWRQMR